MVVKPVEGIPEAQDDVQSGRDDHVAEDDHRRHGHGNLRRSDGRR